MYLLEPQFKEPNNNCCTNNEKVFFFGDSDAGDLYQDEYEIDLSCISMEHFIGNFKLKVKFVDVDGNIAHNIEDIFHVLVSQTIKESDRDFNQQLYHFNWLKLVAEYSDEIHNLKIKRKELINEFELNSGDLNDDTKSGITTEIESTTNEIQSYNKKIKEIKNATSEFNYKEQYYLNYVEIQYDEFVYFRMNSLDDESIEIRSTNDNDIIQKEIQKYCVTWTLCDKNLKTYRSYYAKRKIISEDTYTVKLPKLDEQVTTILSKKGY